MSYQYDAIIIGGGHNGLVTAAYLAKAGRRVLVLEQRDLLGGAAATEEVFPGYNVDTGALDAGLFHDDIVRELFLKMYGLSFRESPVALFAPQADGTDLTLWRDAARSAADIGRLSQKDAARFPAFAAQSGRLAALLRSMMLLSPPDLGQRHVGDMVAWGKMGLRLKQLGNREMMELMRVLPMPAAEFLDDWFENDRLKGILGSLSVAGTMQGPRSAGTALMLLYQNGCGFPTSRFVAGGMGQLSAALAAAARQKGAEIRTGTAVTRVLIEDGRATGVVLADGDNVTARVVVSNADPRRTFFGLVGPQNLPPHFMRQVRNIIFRGSTARVTLALSGLPQFRGQTDEAQLAGHTRIAPDLDYVERAYDDAKYGRYSARPTLDIVIPTLHDPTLAPDGRHIMSITMQYAPYHLRDTDWESEREPLGDHIVNTLAAYAPNLKPLILDRQVLTPLDLEQTYGLTEGSIYHGQMGLDQLLIMRPVPGYSQYRTPIDSLYLCGAGTHPGGGVTGAPGYNAAREILKEIAE